MRKRRHLNPDHSNRYRQSANKRRVLNPLSVCLVSWRWSDFGRGTVSPTKHQVVCRDDIRQHRLTFVPAWQCLLALQVHPAEPSFHLYGLFFVAISA